MATVRTLAQATPSLDLSLAIAPTEQDYIPGGNRLQSTEPRAPRLPGRAFVQHAPVFHMADPRTRGMGGVLRAFASLAGGADPKCLQLAQWRDLSRRERAALGITEREMDRVDAEHACRPAASRGGPGSNPLLTPPGGR